MTTDEAIVHQPNFDERAHGNQQTQTVNCYEKPFEIRVDEIDINGHLHHTKYLEYCSHTRYCQLVERGWTLDRMAAHGIGAVTLTEEIRYRLEVRLGDLITVTHQVIGYSADGTRWCTRNQVMRPDGASARRSSRRLAPGSISGPVASRHRHPSWSRPPTPSGRETSSSSQSLPA